MTSHRESEHYTCASSTKTTAADAHRLVDRWLLDKEQHYNNETRAYVKDKFRSALWLIKSVEQRQKTIFKVAKSIINFQEHLFDSPLAFCRWCCATSPTTSACTSQPSAAW